VVAATTGDYYSSTWDHLSDPLLNIYVFIVFGKDFSYYIVLVYFSLDKRFRFLLSSTVSIFINLPFADKGLAHASSHQFYSPVWPDSD
jgi:hypothetical protein